MTKNEKIIVMGFTGIAMCSFSDFHEDVEKRLNRAIFSHEFASKEIMAEVKESYRKDFIKLCEMNN